MFGYGLWNRLSRRDRAVLRAARARTVGFDELPGFDPIRPRLTRFCHENFLLTLAPSGYHGWFRAYQDIYFLSSTAFLVL